MIKKNLNIDLYNPDAAKIGKEYPFYIATIGISFEQKVHRPAGIKDYQLLYTAEGCGIGLIDGKEQKLFPNSLLLLPPLTPHEYYRETNAWKTLWLTFNGSALEPFLGHLTKLCCWNGKRSFEDLHGRILELKNGLDLKKCSTALYELLLDFHDFSDETLLQKRQIKNRIFPAVKYMSEHYADDVNIKHVADMVGVTDSHFCRLFKEFAGVRPLEYITALRIAKAKMLLANMDDISVYETGIAVGYRSESYFITQFKKSQGITPDQFRQLQKRST